MQIDAWVEVRFLGTHVELGKCPGAGTPELGF